MTEWRNVRLGDLLEVKHGFAFKGEYFAEDGDFVLLTPGNFRAAGGLKFDPSAVRYYAGPIPGDYVLTPGDLLVVMTDLKQDAPILGAPAFVPEGPALLHNQRLGLVRWLAPEVDPRFVYYFMCSTPYRDAVKASATGSTVRHTAPDRIRAVNLRLPGVTAQQRIADVLTAFDELIENNRQRIEILEKTARSLYREWFVRFRFPGHESAEFVDSPMGKVPAGWRATTLGELAELHYGKALKATARRGGSVPVVGSSGVVGFHDEAIVNGPGIVVGRKGHVGSVIWIHRPFFPIDTTYFVVSDRPMEWLRYLLEGLTFQNSHAAVPGLNRDDALLTEALEPPSSLLQQFADAVSPLLDLVDALEVLVSQATTARDLLLPKLVTGKIGVESLEVDDVFGWAELASEPVGVSS